VEVGYYPEVLL